MGPSTSMQSSSPVLTPTETCESVHVPLPITSSLLRLSGPLNITFQHPQSAAPAAWTPVVGEQNLFVSRSPGGKKNQGTLSSLRESYLRTAGSRTFTARPEYLILVGTDMDRSCVWNQVHSPSMSQQKHLHGETANGPLKQL